MSFKYVRLIGSFLKASAIAEMEYRLNFIFKIFNDVLWYGAQISLFEVLFHHTSHISGWTIESTRVFMGVLFLTDSLWMLFFSENLDRLSDKVRKGELDMILVKPVNAQFMMSLQKMSPAYIANTILTSGWLLWSIGHVPGGSWLRLPYLILLIPCGVAVTYCLKFFFAATSIIFTRAESANYIFYQLYRLGTRPDTIYPPWLRYFVLTLLPVGFIASVPARVVLGNDGASPLVLLAAAVFVATFGIFLSSRYWRFALRFYSSASS